MNLFAKTGRESYKPQQTAEPYAARRAVRYAAADNAQAALQRQFPGMSFVTQQAASQPAAQQSQSSDMGDENVVTQAA